MTEGPIKHCTINTICMEMDTYIFTLFTVTPYVDHRGIEFDL